MQSTNGPDAAKIKLAHAKKYGYVLERGDAQELLTLSQASRENAMKALALLAKFQGCYDRWRSIKERYQLKWRSADSLTVFDSIVNGQSDLKSMIAWVQDTCSKLERPQRQMLIFDCLTGLRADEACQSIHLLQSEPCYLDKGRSMLQHFKYPEVFIRRTKKAYISIATPEVLESGRSASDCGYNAVRIFLRRRGVNMHMKYCRQIFATHLRMSGIEPELVDLLQGRVPRTVFGRHYFRPDFEREKSRIAKAIARLRDRLP